VFYCLDEEEKRLMLEKVEREKMKGAVSVTRFKGLGEMNPAQLRESTVHPDTRRLVQLTIDTDDGTAKLFNLDRLERFEALDEAAATRADQDLRSVWSALKQRTEAPGQVTITIRLRASRLDLARRILGARLSDTAPAEDGWRLATVGYPDVESVRQLLQFGDHIEVLAPESARRRIAELAADLAARHSVPSPTAD
jgi:hypothetical protein